MIFKKTKLEGVFVVSLEPLIDKRGFFARTYCKKEFDKINHKGEFVQINHSYNKIKGTIRGMHFQSPPFQEVKLIRCISGSVFDVIVDLRQKSPTFLQYFSIKLSAENKKMIYVPKNFAHGFQTLSDNSELIYHHTEFYNPKTDSGIRFDDPKLNINWPLEPKMISEKDCSYKFMETNFKGL